MRMMLVGAGAVGESILKVMQWRDPKGEWLEYVLVCDYDLKRAEEVVTMMKGDTRFEASKIDATNTEEMAEMIREHKIDFVMDAAPPFASNMIFDAAFKTGADYGSMGTWSVPMEHPAYGLGIEEHDQEGRVITLEFEEYYFVTVYTPNSQNELARLPYRMKWEDDFLAYLKRLEENKPVIFCGDLNVAHKEIDLKNPKTNRKNAGFTDEERGKFSNLLEAGFVDTFRYFYPDQEGIYSWWSYRFSARAKNAGWRIDYFCVSEALKDRLVDAKILTDVMGSDHCPVVLEMK